MNLKKIIKEEINDLQWVKDVDFFVPFESAKYGTIYKAKIINERLSDDISENCGLSYLDIDKDYFVWVERELKNVESNDIFCDNQHYVGTEPALHLFFYSSKTGNYIDDLWITEDVVKLYPTDVKPNYKEGNLVLKESDGLEWIQGGPDFNLQTSEFYIDLDGISNEETCEIQQKILDVGVYWSGKGKKLKKEHCNNSKAYIIKKGKLYISTYNYNEYNTMVKQLKDTTENFPRLYGKNFSQLFK